jgi:hypothetical protein
MPPTLCSWFLVDHNPTSSPERPSGIDAVGLTLTL